VLTVDSEDLDRRLPRVQRASNDRLPPR